MATLRAIIQGSRGAVSCLGSNCIEANVSGWDCGVRVWGTRTEDGSVLFEVYETGGSHDQKRERLIGTVKG